MPKEGVLGRIRFVTACTFCWYALGGLFRWLIWVLGLLLVLGSAHRIVLVAEWYAIVQLKNGEVLTGELKSKAKGSSKATAIASWPLHCVPPGQPRLDGQAHIELRSGD